MNDEILDVVIVGGGPSGLSAAWQLRGRSLVVLEERRRLGGRLKSESRGPYWMNFGGHLFPGAGSNMHNLVRELGLEVIEIPGLKTAMTFAGKVYRSKRVEAYPFVLPMSLKERIELVWVGTKLMTTVARWHRIAKPRQGEPDSARRERIAKFRFGKTFRDLLGRPSRRVDEIFQAAARRAAAEPEQQSAGVGVALFGAVWSGKKDNTALNLDGGSGRFGQAMQEHLGDRIRVGAAVQSVRQDGDLVRVRYLQDGREHTVTARQVVVAVPAHLAREVVADIPAAVDGALQVPRYGSWVGMTMITDEPGPMPYDDIYAMTTPDRTFDMFFNHANPLRRPGRREPGGSLMCYAGGETAQRLLKLSDAEITDIYTREILELFPTLRGHIVESHIQRWLIGGTYRTVSDAAAFEPLIEYCREPGHRIHFAGDYFAPLGQMEVAVTSGKAAAEMVSRELMRESRTSSTA
ncbi:flavin monoamine oxidase family protein [Saccharopolyspora phatthalungensis]|uniref:Oxygen-dependent protoporphyrinogen oxidase n=1 Tax=Saccharopolyspora phatthalungensis TaxID=664693 RepID=A0A840QB21_9PSEU|nr:NAD(P)/FAD-dependent oxidoreductase [Saccharopolyspora phatthalungensis]MBB5157147.1 oxygen-dependent protoporphyrinogen oxidase [Saccharopolyspora phatthalungensis]